MANDEKAQREEQVTRLFCIWHGRERGLPSQFVRLAAPPAPDAVIRVAQQEIYVELARYRELGPHNSSFQYDQALRNAIFDRSLQAPDLPPCTPTLMYREARPGWYAIPPRDKHDSFIAEFFEVVRRVASLADDRFVEVTFANQAQAAARRARASRRCVAEDEYPVVSHFCRAVRIHRHPRLPFGRPASSLDARFTRIDFESITKTVTQKLAKIPAYRGAMGGQPLWLLFYSEGYPASARVGGPNYNERVIQHVRAICARGSNGFDAVWWLDRAFAAQGPTAYRVLEGMSG